MVSGEYKFDRDVSQMKRGGLAAERVDFGGKEKKGWMPATVWL